MERKEFLKTCGFACLGMALPGMLLESCSTGKMITATMDSSGMTVPLSAFQSGKNTYRKYVMVQHEKLKYPVCVYRLDETNYSALLMRCTHQGAELQVFGDRLECPAHGSQFTSNGAVINGPADTNLRSFKVSIQQDQLHIALS